MLLSVRNIHVHVDGAFFTLHHTDLKFVYCLMVTFKPTHPLSLLCPVELFFLFLFTGEHERSVAVGEEKKKLITDMWSGTILITPVRKSPWVRWAQGPRRTAKQIFERLGCWVESLELLWIPCCLSAKQRWRTTTDVPLFAPVVVGTIWNKRTQCRAYSD